MNIEKTISTTLIDGKTEALKKLFAEHDSSEILKLCESSIFTAFAYNHTEVIEFLLDAGLNPNLRNVDTGWTVLHAAVHGCQMSIVKKLIQLGVVIDAKDNHGNTPLFRAMPKRNKCQQVIKILLNHGADKTIANNYGVSPEDLAKRFKFDLDAF